ncbi:MAG: NUDIX domain-containing protein [Dehalococcoidia bacterium]|jgi:ADP-ribose pyrophosphatase YjhB (NUDIX family)|nr:NUDIX domain-containing protein [Dehalococcoidia bacterium]
MALAVAAAILEEGGGKVFLVRRPEGPEEEFPGLWGLPAATLRPEETPPQGVERLGREKLGLGLVVGELLARGQQLRGDHVLTMFLFAAHPTSWPPSLTREGRAGITLYTEWTWGEPRLLIPAARMGSLCSRLLLDYLGIEWA